MEIKKTEHRPINGVQVKERMKDGEKGKQERVLEPAMWGRSE